MDFQEQLFNDLMALVQWPESAFYFVDHNDGGTNYRVFNYRLASYSDFLKPNALNCRGTMFKLDENYKFVSLASLPPLKFFNWKENPMTMNLDLNEIDLIMDKMDGSLMTTYHTYPNEPLMLKSKTSLTSDQALAANKYLFKNRNLYAFLDYAHNIANCSISLEWISPEHRIVVGYQEEYLTVLEGRSLSTGEEIRYSTLKSWMKEFDCEEHLVHVKEVISASDFIHSIANIKDNIEGFVVRMRDGLKMKIKTDQYASLHHCKDSVTIPRRLYEVVVNEAHDDLRAMFATDQFVLNRIDEYESLVKGIYQKLEDGPIRFHRENSHLSKKDFAIKGQAELPKLYFSIAMSLYIGRTVDYKEFLIKHYDDFKMTDNESFEEEAPTKMLYFDIEATSPDGSYLFVIEE